MNSFTIKDLEKLSGIKAHTIRIWEQRYSFLKPKRSSTNIRFYDSDELKTLLNVALLNRNGLRISQIDKMSPETIREKILDLDSAEAQQERIINSLLHSMVELDGEVFEEILDDHIQHYGVNKAISYLIFPFLSRVGILWMTDHVRVAQEHLVTNIIRQKLIKGIHDVSNLQMGTKTVVMYLPEGELHEIGLLYVCYLLKIRGTKIIYLGSNLPLDELEFVVKMKKPDYIYAHLTSVPGKFNFEKYISTLSSRLKSTSIVFSGRVAQNYFKKVPANVLLKNSLQEVVDELTG
jgi:DNA-binding transcriptional MerR regulator